MNPEPGQPKLWTLCKIKKILPRQIDKETMATSRNIVLALLLVAIALAVFYMMDPTMGGLLGRRYEGFYAEEKKEEKKVLPDAAANASVTQNPTTFPVPGEEQKEQVASRGMIGSGAPSAPSAGPAQPPQGAPSSKGVEGFANLSPADMPFPDADKPVNCYPKRQLAPQELLPNDANSKWAAANPMGQGDISGKNFLSAGHLIGVNTVGQSLRNANQQLRSEPPCPQGQVSIWNQSTIEPDLQRKPLEGF